MLKQQHPKAQDKPNNDPSSDGTSRPAAVDFIDNRLPKYHPAFVNSSSHYDAEDRKYVPNTQVVVSAESGGAISLSNSSEPIDYGISSPRPNWTNIEALRCWNDLFPAALNRLMSTSQEPSGRSKSEYSIRQDKSDWNAVYNVLENAKAKYEQSNKVAGMLRKTGENIAPVAQALKIASNMDPGSPYSTPVLGAVNIFLDVRSSIQRTTSSQWNLSLMCVDIGRENCCNRPPASSRRIQRYYPKDLRYRVLSRYISGGSPYLKRITRSHCYHSSRN